MEYETAERNTPPYAERLLHEQIQFACDQIFPSENFRLTLDGKIFKITKEEASSAGIRRIKAVLV